MRATNATTHPVDLQSGRSLAPGETGDVDSSSAHDQALLDSRQLVEADQQTAAEPKSKPSRKSTTEQETE